MFIHKIGERGGGAGGGPEMGTGSASGYWNKMGGHNHLQRPINSNLRPIVTATHTHTPTHSHTHTPTPF